MTLVLEAPSPAAGETPRSWLRRYRGGVLLVAALLLALLGLVLVSGVGRSGSLDPDSYEPSGAHALAALLQRQGVAVVRVGDVPAATRDLPDRAVLFVSDPSLLSAEELSDLQGAGATLVLAQAGPETVAELGVPASVAGLLRDRTRAPGCGDPAAVAAADVRLGGLGYDSTDGRAVRCYGGGLLRLPDQDLVLLGSATALANERLGGDGNAELGLQLLGSGTEVRWLVPDPARPPLGDRPAKDLGDLLPPWVHATELWLVVVLLLLVGWRGRRLGRVVSEPLPVVVRSAEAVEGRGRLYRAAGARDTAGEALRAGARDRIAARLTLQRGADPSALVERVAERTGRSPADVHALLYGPPPADDPALVRLARALDALALEVASS